MAHLVCRPQRIQSESSHFVPSSANSSVSACPCESRRRQNPALSFLFRSLCIVLALVASTAVHPDPVPLIEPNVVSVQTLGRWESGPNTGQYKVVVTTEGWEHVWSRVFVQWLPDPISPDADWKVAANVELVPPGAPGVMVLQATATVRGKSRLLVTVRATPNQGLSELGVKKAVYRFEATTPGKVKQLAVESR